VDQGPAAQHLAQLFHGRRAGRCIAGFGQHAKHLKPLGAVLALFSTPNLIDLKQWQLAQPDGSGIGFVIYPSRNQNALCVGVGYGTQGAEAARHDIGAQRNMVATKCEQSGGFFPKPVDAMKFTDQFYYNEAGADT